MRIVGHGHPAVRATHGKTLEFTSDPTITARATCVAAVASIVDSPGPIAGHVRVTVTAGSESFSLRARANPGWDPRDGAVIRRSPTRTPNTIATHADASSADLPRSLVAALTDPATEVVVEIQPVTGPALVVLAMADRTGPLPSVLHAELAAADVAVAEDAAAAALLGERAGRAPVSSDGRVLVLACDGLPGRSLSGLIAQRDVETVGLPPALAAAVASPGRGDLLIVTAGGDARSALRTAPAGARVVIDTTSDRVSELVTLAAALRSCTAAVVAAADRPPMRIGLGESLPGRDAVSVCLEMSDHLGIDPAVRAAISALLADGVPTRSAARALAALTGWDRRRAYDAILAWPDAGGS